MIHLDTNYLIGLLVKGSPQALHVDGWLAAGSSAATTADNSPKLILTSPGDWATAHFQ